MAGVRLFDIEMRCLLCGRGYELELDSLDQLPRCGTRCLVKGCGGTLFVAHAASNYRYGVDPASLNWDEERRRPGRPRKTAPTTA